MSELRSPSKTRSLQSASSSQRSAPGSIFSRGEKPSGGSSGGRFRQQQVFFSLFFLLSHTTVWSGHGNEVRGAVVKNPFTSSFPASGCPRASDPEVFASTTRFFAYSKIVFMLLERFGSKWEAVFTLPFLNSSSFTARCAILRVVVVFICHI